MQKNIELIISYTESDVLITYTRFYSSKEAFITDHREVFDLCYGAGCWTVD